MYLATNFIKLETLDFGGLHPAVCELCAQPENLGSVFSCVIPTS